MTLENFETHIDSTILERGLSYYEYGYVSEVELLETNEYSIIVEGTEAYEVCLKFDKDNNLSKHNCDCPYDWGPICKHEVAALYHLKYKGRLGQLTLTPVLDDLKAKLQKYSKQELANLLIDLARQNKDVRTKIKDDLD